MTTPGPLPEVPQILPRQEGESAYAYRKRRSIALTGETPYQRRIRLGQARGISSREAAGHRLIGGQTEYQRRAQRTQERYGLSPWEFWRNNQITWLQDNGFTPEATGWSWNRLIRAAPKIRKMNGYTSRFNQITPELIYNGRAQEDQGDIPHDWTWERFNERYNDIVEYYEQNNIQPARQHAFYLRDRMPEVEVQWWFYR